MIFQIELERLNTATDDINKLEVDLDVSINYLLLKHDFVFVTVPVAYLDFALQYICMWMMMARGTKLLASFETGCD